MQLRIFVSTNLKRIHEFKTYSRILCVHEFKMYSRITDITLRRRDITL